jgi:hypothetical protein
MQNQFLDQREHVFLETKIVFVGISFRMSMLIAQEEICNQFLDLTIV